MTRIVHKLIAKTAKGIAAEAWEIMSSNDDFHRKFPCVEPFVAYQWQNFVGHARAALVAMLAHKPGTENNPTGPEYLYTKHVRDEIEEALIIEGAHKAVPPPVSAHDLIRHGSLH